MAAPIIRPRAHRIDPVAANTAMAARLVTRLAILALARCLREPVAEHPYEQDHEERPGAGSEEPVVRADAQPDRGGPAVMRPAVVLARRHQTELGPAPGVDPTPINATSTIGGEPPARVGTGPTVRQHADPTAAPTTSGRMVRQSGPDA